MTHTGVPKAQFGVIGGSGSLSFEFPAALGDERVEVLAEDLRLRHAVRPLTRVHALPRDGPARSPRGTRGEDARVAPRREARGRVACRLFWVFAEAGVTKVLADGGVGSLNHLLDPRDVVVPNDFIDLTVTPGHLRPRRPPADHAPPRMPRPRGSPRRQRREDGRFPRVFRAGRTWSPTGPGSSPWPRSTT